jgi:4'-phosphopantetheinyl transferase EntD
LLGQLLPPGAVAAEAYTDIPGTELFPAELAAIARAGEKRRQEFATVRHCARRALGGLGLPAVALLPGRRGEPGWPPGVVGSMTHCDGYRGAAVAVTGMLRSLGIDAEPHGPLPDGVLAAIAVAEERRQLSVLAAADGSVHWDRLLFSAKEAVYKAWYPLTHRPLGFRQATVSIDRAGTAFRARIVDARGVNVVDGRWLVDHGLVLTAVAVALRTP